MTDFQKQKTKLKMLRREDYLILSETDPLIYYYLPFFGPLYRRRVEMALEECAGGQRILEIGYGSGLTFPNLAEVYKDIHGIELFADGSRIQEMWNQRGIQTHLRQGDLLALPYEDNYFDTVLIISTLEHIQPNEQQIAMAEMYRTLKPGGQMIYGVPVERPLMVSAFKMLGHDIREDHFSTEQDVAAAARARFDEVRIRQLKSPIPFTGAIYEVGHFTKSA